jgi:hypothetical protein
MIIPVKKKPLYALTCSVCCWYLSSAQGAPSPTDRWIGVLPARTAVCWKGTSGSTEEYADVPAGFVAKMRRIKQSGALFFTSIAADQSASRVDWTICAVVDRGVAAPDGLDIATIPATQSVFAICNGSEDTSKCVEATVAAITPKLTRQSDIDEITTALPLATKTTRPTLTHQAAVALLIRTDIKLVNEGVTLQDAGRMLASLADSTAKRPMLTSATPQPNAADATDQSDKASVIAIPISQGLAETLKSILN